ncbi:MAG: chromate transporter [Clostridia bacterium]|nr:chromate transporter [Clostridia bacterium]
MLELFLAFCKIGAFTFGGGYAMLPVIKREIVENKKWATETEVADYFTIGQCTPGVIAVNTATFIGCKQKGLLGGTVATIGVITPPFFIILIIAAFIQSFAEYQIVQDALWGIRIVVAALIINAFCKLTKKNIKDITGIIIFAVAFACSVFLSLPITLIVVAAAVTGITLKSILKRRNGR